MNQRTEVWAVHNATGELVSLFSATCARQAAQAVCGDGERVVRYVPEASAAATRLARLEAALEYIRNAEQRYPADVQEVFDHAKMLGWRDPAAKGDS